MLGSMGYLKTAAVRGYSTLKGGFHRGGFEDCFSGGNYFMKGNNPMFYFHGLVLAALVVVIIILLIKKSKKKKSTFESQMSKQSIFNDKDLAIQILNKRYANGEIDDEEYITRKQNLTYDFSLNNLAEGKNEEDNNDD
ncbi:hypothetical protein SH2C18_16800 [Clostridium sediminicola]|uniref:SHOCT domain-containing protein n=1 Tax=Clostridium sediminicola TaxID=3114879 RepID=UPI0031F1DFA8